MAKKDEVNSGMNFVEVMQKCPEAGEIMMKHGLHCVGCAMAHAESIEEGCRGHGMSDEDIERLMDDINATIKKKK